MSSPPIRDDHQLEQDIDAARQMSRARLNSTATPVSPSVLHPHSPAAIPNRNRRTSSSTQQHPSPVVGRGETSDHYFRNHDVGSNSALAVSPPRHSQTMPVPVSGSSRGNVQGQAALARFYQQSRNRHGSNTSLDSAQHFIDHRGQGGQPYSLHPHSPTALHHASGGRSGLQESGDQMYSGPPPPLERSPSSFQRNTSEQASHSNSAGQGQSNDLDDHEHEEHCDSPHHTMSRRPSLLEDDVCFPLHDEGGVHEDLYPGHHIDHELEGPLPPGFPFTFDMQALEEYASEERNRIGGGSGATDAIQIGSGMRNRRKDGRSEEALAPGVLGASHPQANYGISPDSDDAQFYRRRPRHAHPAEGTGSSRYQRKLAMFEQGGAPPPPAVGPRGNILGTGTLLEADRKGNNVSAATPLLDKDGSGLPSYNGATSVPGAFPHADPEPVRLPRSYSTGALSTERSRNGARVRPLAAGFGVGGGGQGYMHYNAQPYRFTFYSNALPSTIHARHLAELPAPGQTFESLFSGRPAQSADEPSPEAAEPRSSTDAQGQSASGPASRAPSGTGILAAQLGAAVQPLTGRMEGSTAPPTGANTPLGNPGANSGAGVSVKAAATASAAQLARTAAAGGQGAPSTAAGSMRLNTPPSASAALGGNGVKSAKAGTAARAFPGGGIRMDQDPEANTWWLDVLSPTDQEMKLLSRVFGIHPLTTEDILMEETREKIELFRNYYLVCFRSFDQDPYSPTYLEPLNMYIIVFREGTLSFHFRSTPHPQNVRRRIKQLKDYINVTSDWISYALIDDITDAFGPLIQGIEYEVDSIDELVLILKEAEQSDMLRRIGTCRKKVMGLLRLMGNKADVVKGLAKRCNENWSVAPKSDIGLYLSDIQDHLITMTQNLNHYEKILSRSHSNYLAQISIEMTDANNQINDVLSKLTALGTIIVPMNVITGLWGMNVHVPGQDVEDNLHWFFGIVAVMVFFAVVGYIATIRYLSR